MLIDLEVMLACTVRVGSKLVSEECFHVQFMLEQAHIAYCLWLLFLVLVKQ